MTCQIKSLKIVEDFFSPNFKPNCEVRFPLQILEYMCMVSENMDPDANPEYRWRELGAINYPDKYTYSVVTIRH